MTTKITIVYDNVASEGYITGWGFAAVVDYKGKRTLFDAGWDGISLLKNLKVAGIAPSSIDFIVISHKHWDHAGGLANFLNAIGDKRPTVFVPTSFSSSLKAEITKFAELQEVTPEKAIVIVTGLKVTKEFKTKNKNLYEVALVFEITEGLVVLCGCSHPGLETIIQYCQQFGSVYAVIGGFHGFKQLDKLSSIPLIVPCHCTKQKQTILKRYPDTTRKCYSGLELSFD